MMEPGADTWTTVAPLFEVVMLPHDALPFAIDDDLAIDNIPETFRAWDPAQNDGFIREVRQEVTWRESRYCITARHREDAPSEMVNDHEARRFVANKVRDVATAFWLQRSSRAGHRLILHTKDSGSGDEMLRRDDWVRGFDNYEMGDFSPHDLDRIRAFALALGALEKTGAVRTAIDLTSRAIRESSWILRFLNLWLALEALFGPTSPNETTYRLSLRLSIFLWGHGAAARADARRIRASYGLRSKIAHGLRGLDNADPALDTVSLEGLVRRSLSMILLDPEKVTMFDSDGREDYLESLVFGA